MCFTYMLNNSIISQGAIFKNWKLIIYTVDMIDGWFWFTYPGGFFSCHFLLFVSLSTMFLPVYDVVVFGSLDE